jgi:predicted O-linked N-acetylglucosamine transferase (SPINDLY family)
MSHQLLLAALQNNTLLTPDTLHHARTQNPHHLFTQYYLGVYYGIHHNFTAAKERFRACMTLAPTFYAPFLDFATMAFQEKHLQDMTTAESALMSIFHKPTLDGIHPTAQIRTVVDLKIGTLLIPAYLATLQHTKALHLLTVLWHQKDTYTPDDVVRIAYSFAQVYAYSDMEQSLIFCLRALTLQPTNVSLVQHLAIASQYTMSPVHWQSYVQRVYLPPSPPSPPLPQEHSGQRIRVGYMSSCFNRNAVSLFASCLLQHANHDTFDIFCYNTNSHRDLVTDWLATFLPTTQWFDVHTHTTATLSSLIQSHTLDILVDLDAHAIGNRLDVIVTRPARRIVHYLGYPDHAYLPAYDGRITDRHANPEATELYHQDIPHREQTLFLPRSFLCFVPFPMFTVPNIHCRTPPDMVVVGIMNKISKHHECVRDLWMVLAHTYPWLRLHIKLNQGETTTSLYDTLDKSQVTYVHFQSDLGAYYDMFNDIDVCVDTYPYSGTATTCSSLLMGLVPYTVYDQRRHVSNVTGSILLHMGTEHDYVQDHVNASLSAYYKSIEKAVLDVRKAKTSCDRGYIEDSDARRRRVRRDFQKMMNPQEFMRDYEILLQKMLQ